MASIKALLIVYNRNLSLCFSTTDSDPSIAKKILDKQNKRFQNINNPRKVITHQSQSVTLSEFCCKMYTLGKCAQTQILIYMEFIHNRCRNIECNERSQ